MSKKPSEPSPDAIARADRQRLAKEEGARAIADVERRAVEVRQNMQRLRAMREAREADEVRTRALLPQPANKKGKKRVAR